MGMWRLIRGSCDRICSVVLILLFCQLPLFIQQYEMRLSGHVAESARLVQDLEKSAALTHKSLQAYIDKFLQQEDRDFASSGQVMQKTVRRYGDLRIALSSLEHAGPIKRPFVFIAHLQGDVFQESLHNFTPGFSLTLETIAYGVMGLFMWVALLQLLRQLTVKLRAKNS